MKKYLKEFLHRGLIFGGFGPIILAIIYIILQKTITSFSLSGSEVSLGIVSIYILAFLHAGASVFNQIEAWSLPKSLLYHFGTLYLAYVICYLINSWIPFDLKIILIFSVIFILLYFIIWITVYYIVKLSAKKLNEKLK